MTADQIREIAIDSASAYLEYLTLNDKGIQEVDVFEISYPEGRDFLIKLRLSAKLFDTEAIFFKNCKYDKMYDTFAVKIIEYDRDQNMLLLKPSENIQSELYYLKNRDLKVISDLKFLVARVQSWFELNGAKIALPKTPSKYENDILNIKYFDDLLPSHNQIESIHNIFKNPFSYVWGAPGTGKTQFVLAYAVLHYVYNNEKVAILSPTNNSLEQVLRGVVKMTDKAGIDRRKILRLGTPSKKFAEDFPEICEEQGVQKNLHEIDKQIDILDRVIGFEKSVELLHEHFEKLLLFNEIVNFEENHKNDEALTTIQCNAIKKQLRTIKAAFAKDPSIIAILNNINVENWADKKEDVENLLENRKKLLEIDQHIVTDYQKSPLFSVQEELDNYHFIRAKLANSSTEERLKSVNVIACTLDGYIGKYTESRPKVAHIFLDEAGYANIAKTLTLFNHSIPVTFLGDHKQLPPVCEVNDIDIQRDEMYHNMFLWAQSAIFLDSLFVNDRYFCWREYLNNLPFNPTHLSQTSLNATFRFGDNLAKILGKHVYQNNFRSLNPMGETQILYVNAKKEEGIKSRVSITEVQAIQKITGQLKQSYNEDYVILTPYKKQVRLLNSHLPEERNALKILTVHGSQGREWNTVILSVVDTSDKWFVDSSIPISKGLNLVNTAVSRAKMNIIIVCDIHYWLGLSEQLISDLIRNGKELQV